jgi:hypothetical protein
MQLDMMKDDVTLIQNYWTWWQIMLRKFGAHSAKHSKATEKCVGVVEKSRWRSSLIPCVLLKELVEFGEDMAKDWVNWGHQLNTAQLDASRIWRWRRWNGNALPLGALQTGLGPGEGVRSRCSSLMFGWFPLRTGVLRRYVEAPDT